ncbi:Pr6Pr family membrane protein [Herbiconiux sp. CPCC 203407]|uniref:Pr6Pr family membrane protein n=1 Tax=Herbiconiux oxytropis TaxID=2970915 RepID=A0AA42BW97_9MICO|nr:Pr6Pr family membrane protein [Herbiconiux oxytropis]MCS5722141.1 Pr6Pr family membrane protein [Herbiconiux oxytropis]MCS5725723.1 Pr6Pr family membrane protein [Herbiconiux oxytropis]
MTRRIAGALRLIVGLGLAVTIGIQIGDRVANDAFDPWEYFSYFTIQTSLFNIVVLVVGGVLALRLARDPQLYTTVRMAALTYAIVTAAVYNVLLRFVPPTGYPGLDWPNEVVHVWVPIILVLDWLLTPGRPALPWRSLWIVPIYPVAWAIYSFARAAASGGRIYPYPFLNPATDGWISVIAYIVGLTLFLVGLGALAVLYSRRVGGSRRLSGPGVS